MVRKRYGKSLITGRERGSRIEPPVSREQNRADDRTDNLPPPGQSRTARVLLFVGSFLPVIATTVAALIFGSELKDLHTIGIVGIFIVNIVSSGSFVLPVPGLATVIIGGTLWNPFLVALAGGTGATIGEITGYLAGMGLYGAMGRVLSRNRWYARIKGWTETRGMVTIFLFAAIPNPFFDVAGFAAGSMRYSIVRFLAACWLGKMVKFCVVAYASYWGANVIRFWLG